jgi:putative phosphoesterase
MSIPKEVFKIFENVEFILHAGDLLRLSVIDELEKVAPVLAVCGNLDEPEVRGRLRELESLTVCGWKVGLMHDPGTLFGTKRMWEIAKKNSFDVLVYGHTHRPHMEWDEKILFVNPGSPTNPLPPFIVKPTVALLRMTREGIRPEIIQVCIC